MNPPTEIGAMTQVPPTNVSEERSRTSVRDDQSLNEMWDATTALENKRTWKAYLPIAVCLLVGMEVGMGIGLASPTDPAATASIEVVPDPALSGNAPDASQSNRFVQGELQVLGGSDLQRLAEAKVPGSHILDVVATQVGTTAVVKVKVVSSSATNTVSLTSALISVYQTERRDAYLANVDKQLNVVSRQITVLAKSAKTDAELSRTGDEYSRLLEVRNNLQLSRDGVEVSVPVIEQPTLASQSRWPRAARYAIVGLVLGGLLGFIIKLLADRVARRSPSRPDWT